MVNYLTAVKALEVKISVVCDIKRTFFGRYAVIINYNLVIVGKCELNLVVNLSGEALCSVRAVIGEFNAVIPYNFTVPNNCFVLVVAVKRKLAVNILGYLIILAVNGNSLACNSVCNSADCSALSRAT